MVILKVSPLVWVMLGFSLSYLLFFIRPIFFSSPEMLFPRYVPAVDPIGVDLNNTLRTANHFLFPGKILISEIINTPIHR